MKRYQEIRITDQLTTVIVDRITGKIVYKFIGWAYDEAQSKAQNIKRLEEAVHLFDMYDNGVQNDDLADYGYRAIAEITGDVCMLLIIKESEDRTRKTFAELTFDKKQAYFVPFVCNDKTIDFSKATVITPIEVINRYSTKHYDYRYAHQYYWQQTIESALDITLWQVDPKLPIEELNNKRIAGNKKYGHLAYNLGVEAFGAIDFYTHGREEILDLANYLALQTLAIDKSDSAREEQLKKLLVMTAGLLYEYEKLLTND